MLVPRRVSSESPSTELMPLATSRASSLRWLEIERAGRRRVERVLDEDRNALRDRRRDRGRVQHLRAEIRQLHRLFVADVRQAERRSRPPSDRRSSTPSTSVQISIDRRAERGADDGGAVVRAVAADGRRPAVLGGADESGHDGNGRSRVLGRRAPLREVGADRAVGPGEVDRRVGELVVGRSRTAGSPRTPPDATG